MPLSASAQNAFVHRTARKQTTARLDLKPPICLGGRKREAHFRRRLTVHYSWVCFLFTVPVGAPLIASVSAATAKEDYGGGLGRFDTEHGATEDVKRKKEKTRTRRKKEKKEKKKE